MKILFIIISLTLSITPCYSEDSTEGSIMIRSAFGKGFGKVLVVEGQLDREKYGKGDGLRRFTVVKVNGVLLNQPITVRLKMYNKAAEYEFSLYAKESKQCPVVILGYEALCESGIPKGVNNTFETMEQGWAWKISTYFVLVRISNYSDGWPAKRGNIKMNQVQYYTYDQPVFLKKKKGQGVRVPALVNPVKRGQPMNFRIKDFVRKK